MNDRCLTDEEMSAYVDGVVDASLRNRIEDHLGQCAMCLHNVAELKQLVDPNAGTVPVPPGALAKAESVISRLAGRAEEFGIVAVLRDGICRVLETTGDLLTPRMPSAVPIRGERRSALRPRVAKSLSGFLVTAELREKKGAIQTDLTVTEEATSAKPDGVKARLYSPGACETKYTYRGKVSLPPLGPGLYRIEIEEIGSIDLEVR